MIVLHQAVINYVREPMSAPGASLPSAVGKVDPTA